MSRIDGDGFILAKLSIKSWWSLEIHYLQYESQASTRFEVRMPAIIWWHNEVHLFILLNIKNITNIYYPSSGAFFSFIIITLKSHLVVYHAIILEYLNHSYLIICFVVADAAHILNKWENNAITMLKWGIYDVLKKWLFLHDKISSPSLWFKVYTSTKC